MIIKRVLENVLEGAFVIAKTVAVGEGEHGDFLFLFVSEFNVWDDDVDLLAWFSGEVP